MGETQGPRVFLLTIYQHASTILSMDYQPFTNIYINHLFTTYESLDLLINHLFTTLSTRFLHHFSMSHNRCQVKEDLTKPRITATQRKLQDLPGPFRAVDSNSEFRGCDFYQSKRGVEQDDAPVAGGDYYQLDTGVELWSDSNPRNPTAGGPPGVSDGCLSLEFLHGAPPPSKPQGFPLKWYPPAPPNDHQPGV